jgi:hypothetical protein
MIFWSKIIMSSTSNAQNYLVNVFRPVYTYDPISNVFSSKLEFSNVDTVSGNSLSVYTASIGDANSNTYVGINAGNSYTLLKNCVYNTALGSFAGNNISNASNCVFVGYHAGDSVSDSSNVIAIGANANGVGSNNIYIGKSTGGPGNGNIFLGHNLQNFTSVSNTFYLGNSISNITMAADLANKYVGVNCNTPQYSLDVAGYVHISNAGLGINTNPQSHSLNVNGDMYISDGYGSFYFGKNVFNTTCEVNANSGFSSYVSSLSNASNSLTASSQIVAGTMVKGVIQISAIDVTGSTYDYVKIMVYNTSNNPAAALIQRSSNATIIKYTTGDSNIYISNASGATHTFNWNVTYFPCPGA